LFFAAQLAALVLAPALASAEPLGTGIRIDQMQPASPESPFFRAEGPGAPFREGVRFAAGLTFEYGKGVLRAVGVDEQGGKTDLATLVDHALLARVSASISPLHWLSFDLSLPFALVEAGDDSRPYGGQRPAKAEAPAFGDIRFGAHFRPINDPTFSLIVGGRFWAPVGSQQAYLSDADFRAEVDIGAAGELKTLLYGATLHVAPGLFLRRSGDRAAASLAVHYKLTPSLSVGLEPTVALFTLRDTRDNDTFALLVEPMAAARLRLGSFLVGLAVGPGFGGAPGTAEVRGLLNVAYAGRGKPPKAPKNTAPADRDLDKIPDARDACPDEAGPDSRDPKQRGCPARDRDGDGIRDEEDYCPDRVGVAHVDPKANGCPDSDNDTLPDPIDACKNEPGTAENGCPKHARMTTAGFDVKPPIAFQGDKLTPESLEALEEIAATMRANQKLEQVSIGIGTKGADPKLADRRAQQVLLVLRRSSLDPTRYEVVLRDDLRAGSVVVRLIR